VATAGSRPTPQSTQQNVCYPAQATASYARRITISDSVARLKAIVGRALDFCLPATVDGVESDPSLSLTCYGIRASAMSRRDLGYYSNAFGAGPLVVESPSSFCVSSSPTTKPPEPLRLTCYSTVAPTNSKTLAKSIGDTVRISRDSVTLPPVSLCTGSRQGATSPVFFLCYPDASETTGPPTVLTDEWGAIRASLGQRDRLCIQTSVKLR
jgi:hypothetical protein